MKKYNNILYLVDNYVMLYSKKRNEILRYKLPKNILKYGKIADINKFVIEYQKLVKDNNLNNFILGETIHIIINPEYTNADKDILTNIFINMNYRKVSFISEIKQYKLNMTNAYLNYNNEYSILFYINEYKKKEIYMIPSNYVSKEEYYKFIKNKINDKTLFVVGNSNSDELITEFEEKYHNKCYRFANALTYLFDSVLNSNG